MEGVTELWAVLSASGDVLWTRGGSSTRKRLMVYPTQAMAQNVLKSPWIKQIIPDPSQVIVACIYRKEDS